MNFLQRLAATATDRPLAALAKQIAPRVGGLLAPALAAELEKFRQEMNGAAASQAAPMPYVARHRDIAWFHSIDLGEEGVTAGRKTLELLEAEFDRLELSYDTLAGRRVLDIGCNDGFFALKCERLGGRVTAIDGIYSEGLKYIRNHLRPKFAYYCIDLLSPSFGELGQFDVILYLGVLYHTMYPFEQLVRIANACSDGAALLLETGYYNIPGMETEPTLLFNYEGKVTSDLSSPVWPSIEWLKQTLRRIGFAEVIILDTGSAADAPVGRVTLRANYRADRGERSPVLYAAEQV
jgi:tRNA (mo5U34)-methyltransferase